MREAQLFRCVVAIKASRGAGETPYSGDAPQRPTVRAPHVADNELQSLQACLWNQDRVCSKLVLLSESTSTSTLAFLLAHLWHSSCQPKYQQSQILTDRVE
eukprot:2868246-Amphidinium_carterae.1